MLLLGGLLLVPLVASLLTFIGKGNAFRNIVVKVAAVITVCLAVMAGFEFMNNPTGIQVGGKWLSELVTLGDIALCLVILYYTFVRYKKFWIGVLELLQLGILLCFEYHYGEIIPVYNDLIIDNLAVIMILIVGIIGSLIAVFSLGYMEKFQEENSEVKDRRPFFFAVIFLFLAGMFGLVTSNNLLNMYMCWELTSLCSFLLIGYTETREATENAFKALWMNLLGGLAFAIAIAWIGVFFHTVELDMLRSLEGVGPYLTLPLALLVFCGFTKAAMMPFSGWLLGAMVAPTPTSALLHSSTMVKAGVFLIIKLCPLLGENYTGYMTMFVGGVTFFFASCAAISQSDGKKVLAYSTISNLGLIICCAGIGTYQAAWTAVMLVIFHAVAKSLLFLSVGTAEQCLGSRNIESFDGMFCRLPHVSVCMIIGICGMFLAPFGMLISKWAAMKAFVDAGHPLLLLFIVFGSATTFFYWTKWLGKITAVIHDGENKEAEIAGNQWLTLKSLSALTIIACVAFPLISRIAVIPYLQRVYLMMCDVISQENLLTMSFMAILIVFLPLISFGKGRRKEAAINNLGGLNTGDNKTYYGSAGRVIPVQIRNWYMEEYFGAVKMHICGFSLCTACILVAFALIIGGVAHV